VASEARVVQNRKMGIAESNGQAVLDPTFRGLLLKKCLN